MEDARPLRGPVPLSADAERLLDAVREAPACNLTDARTYAGLERRAFSAALDAVVAGGLVHRVQVGRHSILLPDRPGILACMQQIQALWDPRTRRLHSFLRDEEVHPRQEVVEETMQWGWSEDATRWHLRCLEKADLVQAIMNVRDPRCVTYRYLPANPLVHDLVARASCRD